MKVVHYKGDPDWPFCMHCQKPVESVLMGEPPVRREGEARLEARPVTIRCHGETWQGTMKDMGEIDPTSGLLAP
jgi:hypothetical protein